MTTVAYGNIYDKHYNTQGSSVKVLNIAGFFTTRNHSYSNLSKILLIELSLALLETVR